MKKLKSHKTFGGTTSFWSHESRETGTTMKFSTFIPAEAPKECLIWLSGLTCTDENFITKAGAQRALARHGLMVICPDTSPRGLDLPGEHDSWDFGSGAGFYLDATVEPYRSNYRMGSYITREIFEIVEREFSVSRVSISGHSMGGHGALTLALRDPSKFRSASAFSPIVNPAACPWGEKAFRGYLGEDRALWAQHDATELVRAGARHPAPILIDQGTSDEFLEKQLLTENFVRACCEKGQPLEARYQDGYDHSYYFVSTFIESHIEFHARAMGAGRT